MDSDPTTSDVHLWLSAPVLPPEGGAVVMCLVNPTDTEFRTGRGGRFEISDGSDWSFVGSFSASTDDFGTVNIGPQSGYGPLQGFHARAGEIGTAEYLRVPPLEPGRYRFWHQDGPSSPVGPDGSPRRAYGEFDMSDSAPVVVPIEIENAAGAGLWTGPLLLPPTGGPVSIEGFTQDRSIEDFPVALNVQPWADKDWGSPSLSLTPRKLTEYPFGQAVDLPALPAGPYRLSCEHPDLGEIARVFWVVDGLPGLVANDE